MENRHYPMDTKMLDDNTMSCDHGQLDKRQCSIAKTSVTRASGFSCQPQNLPNCVSPASLGQIPRFPPVSLFIVFPAHTKPLLNPAFLECHPPSDQATEEWVIHGRLRPRMKCCAKSRMWPAQFSVNY